MSIQKINPRFTLLLILIMAVAAMRIPNAAQLTTWSNFTPIGAMGLFGGAYFNSRWKKIAFPLLTLFVSDIIINLFIHDGKYGVMYGGWYLVYGIFIAIVFMGEWLIRKVSVKNILIASVSAAMFHWLAADFAVWAAGGTDLRTGLPLSRGWSGLQQCYLQGLPFMRNFLAGTLAYSALMFGAFEWMKKLSPKFATNDA
ncbi:MAG: DUF6580 family putative transport protein [Ferruginibacter sp.]